MRQDAGPGAFGMAFQIHRDIEFTGRAAMPRPPRSLMPRTSSKSIEGPDQPRPHGAAIIPAEGNGGDFKTRPVMALDQAGDQFGGGMLVEIRRQIGDADAVMVVALAGPKRRVGLCGRRSATKVALQRAGASPSSQKGQKVRGGNHRAACRYRLDHQRAACPAIAPDRIPPEPRWPRRPGYRDGPGARHAPASKAANASS